jgi:activator of HSP90 ATPase
MRDQNDSSPLALAATRRQLMASVAAGFVGLTVTSGRAWAADESGLSHLAEAIHQEPVFRADRKRIYAALTDARQFEKVVRLSAAKQSGEIGNTPAEISSEVGGAFTIFGGYITGRHIDLIPSERIVQAWRVQNWKPGEYSIVRFEFVDQGSGTKILFDHKAFPEGHGPHLAAGWKANYWEPLDKYLSGSGNR